MSVDADRSQRGEGGWMRWRERMLLTAGFDGDLATRLAGEGDLDLHALLELVDRGCSPHLAARILAPLYRETR